MNKKNIGYRRTAGKLMALVSVGLLVGVAGCSHKESAPPPAHSQANSTPPEVQQEFKNAPH